MDQQDQTLSPSAPAARPSPSRRASPLVLAAAVLLALAAAGLSIRALGQDPTATGRQGTGLYEGPDAPTVESLIERMSGALIAMQREDGSFDPGQEGGVQTDQEQLAADALATAALAQVRALGPAFESPFLLDACERGLAWIRKNQADDGRIGPEAIGPEGRYFQVDATAAAMHAFVTSADLESLRALKAAGPALGSFAEQKLLRNGWSRALVAMAVDRVYAANRQNVFPEEARQRRIVNGRQVGERRDHHDMSVAEAIVRLVLRRILGQAAVADRFPAEILAACLENPPRWKNLTSDMQLWWMQAWVVKEAGEGGVEWFHDLVLALDEEALEPDGRVPGGYYATSLVQTSAALLALAAGFQSQAAGG